MHRCGSGKGWGGGNDFKHPSCSKTPHPNLKHKCVQNAYFYVTVSNVFIEISLFLLKSICFHDKLDPLPEIRVLKWGWGVIEILKWGPDPQFWGVNFPCRHDSEWAMSANLRPAPPLQKSWIRTDAGIQIWNRVFPKLERGESGKCQNYPWN